MAKPAKDVTAAELAILEKLWEHEFATASQLSGWLYGSTSASDLATVQKLLSRLEKKECVVRDRDHWPHHFSASVDREGLLTSRLQATADELGDGNLSSLITHLVKSTKLNSKQRQRLRDMLGEFDSQ